MEEDGVCEKAGCQSSSFLSVCREEPSTDGFPPPPPRGQVERIFNFAEHPVEQHKELRSLCSRLMPLTMFNLGQRLLPLTGKIKIRYISGGEYTDLGQLHGSVAEMRPYSVSYYVVLIIGPTAISVKLPYTIASMHGHKRTQPTLTWILTRCCVRPQEMSSQYCYQSFPSLVDSSN